MIRSFPVYIIGSYMSPARPNPEHSKNVREVLELLDIGISIIGSDHTLLFANSAMRKISRIEPVIGAPVSRVFPRHRLLTENGEPVPDSEYPLNRAFAGEDVRDVIHEYIDPEGDHWWLCTSAQRITDERGNLRYILLSAMDISRRIHKEKKLAFMIQSAKILSLTTDFRERLVEKARHTVPSLADWCAIDILNEHGDIERVTVVHRDPVMVEYIQEFEKKYPSDPSRPGSISQVIKTQQPRFFPNITDEMLRTAAQSPEHYDALAKLQLRSIMVIPIVSGGTSLGTMTLAYAESGRTYTTEDFEFFKEFCYHLGILLDNSRLYDEIQKRDAAKDLFLASLSHELRNPLAPIKSSLELLRLKNIEPDVQEELDVIEHQFEHMRKLLHDLLDVTRFTRAQIAISPAHIELRRLVERALKSSDALLTNADITLHFTYPSVPIEIHADETRLEQAISNLMSNAIKFTPAGGSIWVDIGKDGVDAVITVRDNGTGIDPQDLPNIFDMYYQGMHGKTVSSGLGIGLLLVSKIVELHGGTVSAESEGIGKGSTFTVRIPLSRTSAPQSGFGGDNQVPDPRGKKILIVDDNMPAANSLVRLLNKLGASAQAFYSGEETLAHVGLSEFDVIFLDIGMPRMDGYELVKALRDQGVTVPIVALTGYGLAEDKSRAHEAGFDAHLTKPIGLKELNALFNSIFSSSTVAQN